MAELTSSNSSVSFRRLVWLMPAAYALHIAEEYSSGFAVWVTQVVGGSMDEAAFAFNNAAFMAILLGLTAWASRGRSSLAVFLLTVWASANLFWDFLFHLVTTRAFDRASPGLLTASLLYYPISIVAGRALLREGRLSAGRFGVAVALGAALMGFVIWYGLFHFAL
jgi:hypothetical protein